MKNVIKFTLTASLIVVFTIVNYAQTPATSSANAVVLTALTLDLEAGTSIDFGNLNATTTGAVVLDANGVSNSNTGSITDVAVFDMTGSTGASVTVTYDATVSLSNGATGTMTMTPEVVGDASNSNQATAAAITSGSQVTLDGTTGDYFIWVGGSIPTLTAQETGTYSGTFNISVEYN